jgi:hypothetical protein
MKLHPLLISLLIASPLALAADTPKQQFKNAQKEATADKKDVLMIFSGAGWQDASKNFEETILSSELLQKGIEKDFVKVLINCPRERAEAHKELLELQQTYRFREMPSVILTDQQGRPYAYTGARGSDPAAYLKSLNEFHQIRVERDRLFGEAAKTKGVERAKILIKALETMPQEMVRDFYSPELAAIAEADQKGKTTYVKEIQAAEALRQEQELFGMLLRNKQYDEVIKKAKEAGAKLKGEEAQRVKLYEIQALAAKKEFDEASKGVEELKKMAPESSYGKQSDRYLSSLQNAKAREAKMKEAAKKPAAPIVSKPVAIVNDIEALKKEAKEAEEATAKAIAHEEKLKKANTGAAEKIASLEAELKTLREGSEALKKAGVEREKLARRSKALKEVIENHEAMAQRKREISELEKRAAALQKQAEELRKKAEAIKKGQ